MSQTTQSIPKMIPPPGKLPKNHCIKARKMVPESRAYKCSPSTGKRGARILELSRKMLENGPPNKKFKPDQVVSQSTVNPVPEAPLSTEENPASSPIRTSEPWARHTYSPYASPSAGILKKLADSNSLDCSPNSLTKDRRVSWAYPEVSESVDIPLASNSRSSRTRRSLLKNYPAPSNSEGESSSLSQPVESAPTSVSDFTQVTNLLIDLRTTFNTKL